jgi:phage terminase large subunit
LITPIETSDQYTETDDEVLFQLLLQEELEEVSPKLEAFREPARIKLCHGGRGAGAKSWSISSLLVQKAHREKKKILCTREIQESIEESVHSLIVNQIERLRYSGWIDTGKYIRSPSDSVFRFKGLKDLRAARQIKGYEDYDIFWVEEAATVPEESWRVLIPTLRKPGSELWISFNREEELDPVYERFCIRPRADAMIIELSPGTIDNPWFTPELKREMEEDYKRDPDEAEHVWGGQPRVQGLQAVMSRVKIKGAMDRNIEPVGAVELGIDVARFGDDTTSIYKRKGMKVVDRKTFRGQDTMKTAKIAWDMAEKRPDYKIKVDVTGVGAGVVDRLNELGASVLGVDFGGTPRDKDKYTSVADEMWFEFPIDEADIPCDNDLQRQLSGRRYDYDNKGRRKIESKKEYKKRLGRSPDDADGLILCFYTGGHIIMDKNIKNDMKRRRVKR